MREMRVASRPSGSYSETYTWDEDGPFPETPPPSCLSNEDNDSVEAESPSVSRTERRASKKSSHGDQSEQRFSWSRHHLLAVLLLRDQYKLDLARATAIFNSLFADELAAQSVSNGIDKSKLGAQHADRNRGGLRWRAVHDNRGGDEEATLCAAIETEMQTLPMAITPPRRAPAYADGAASTTSAGLQFEPTTPPQTPQIPRATPLSQKINDGARLISRHVEDYYQYQPVTPEQAHPDTPAILYRYYDNNSYGMNSNKGFVASQFQHLNGPMPPPPACDDLRMFADVENHMNRNPVASPFISVASDLFWIIRLAMKRSQEGAKNARLSIINGEDIGFRKSFYAYPFHEQLKNKKVFTDGAWCYRGTSEFLIWAEIRPEAIRVDISFNHIRESVAKNAILEQIMHLDRIAQRSSSKALARFLKTATVSLDAEMTIALANFLLILGMDAFTPPPMLAKLIADFVRGWMVTLDADSYPRWRTLASTFAYVISDSKRGQIGEEDLKGLEKAFLWGLRSGLGDINWQWKENKTRKMIRKADTAGLDLASVASASASTPRRSIIAPPSSSTPRRSAVTKPSSSSTPSRRPSKASGSGARRSPMPATPSPATRRRGGSSNPSLSGTRLLAGVMIELESLDVRVHDARPGPTTRRNNDAVETIDLTGMDGH